MILILDGGGDSLVIFASKPQEIQAKLGQVSTSIIIMTIIIITILIITIIITTLTTMTIVITMILATIAQITLITDWNDLLQDVRFPCHTAGVGE